MQHAPGDCARLARILTLIEERLRIVADRDWFARDAGEHLAALQKVAGELDKEISSLPADTDPMLRHYLERQSYLKARDWLRDAGFSQS